MQIRHLSSLGLNKTKSEESDCLFTEETERHSHSRTGDEDHQ